MTESKQPAHKHLVAVVDIGSSAIRMVIAELGGRGLVRQLENLSRPAMLGRDVFTDGRIGNQTARECLSILSDFRDIIQSYGAHKTIAIATSALREASNRDNFVDQVFIRTGIDVEVIEGMEENRLGLIAVEKALDNVFDLQKANSLIMEVGAGSTEVTILVKGKVALSRTLPLGSIRIPSLQRSDYAEPAELQRALKRVLRTLLEDLSREFNLSDIDTFIAVGGDMRHVIRHLSGATEGNIAKLSRDSFADFAKSAAKMTPEETAVKLGIPYTEAKLFFPAMMVYAGFLQETKAESIIVPMVSIRDGLLLEASHMLSGYKRSDLSRQMINSAKSLGRKYRYDEAHAANVTALALAIFDQMEKEHGLSGAERQLLEVAAILHDIGIYISPSSHHKHSMYLVEAAEIFGLRKSHKDIVANVVRYHRRSLPKPTHVQYMSLPRPDRVVVSKLAAILRAADALDNSHQQKIKSVRLEKKAETCVFWVDEKAGDIALERQSLAEKSNMFSDIYGLSLSLRQEAPSAQTAS